MSSSPSSPSSPNAITPEQRFEIQQDFWRLRAETRARVTILNKERMNYATPNEMESVDYKFEPPGGLMRWMQERYIPPF
jgi:hypothetical protein